jgi:hypothetical protein
MYELRVDEISQKFSWMRAQAECKVTSSQNNTEELNHGVTEGTEKRSIDKSSPCSP